MKKLAITFAFLLGAIPTNYAMEQEQDKSSQLPSQLSEQTDEAMQGCVSSLSNTADDELMREAFTMQTTARARIQVFLEERVQGVLYDSKAANNFNSEIMKSATIFFDAHKDNKGYLRYDKLNQSFTELPEGYFKMMVRLAYYEHFRNCFDDCRVDIINSCFYKKNGALNNEIVLVDKLVPQKYLFGVVEWLRVRNALCPITYLNLRDNELTDLCPELGYLSLTKILVCDGNRLHALPRQVAFMPSLSLFAASRNTAKNNESFVRFSKEVEELNEERNALCVILLKVKLSQICNGEALVPVDNLRRQKPPTDNE